ncbi:DUF790 family protein [Bradyrhizobium sp. AS23.2]|nr:DUF790 family protein [Bradyrhizobium sp. AS23.2]
MVSKLEQSRSAERQNLLVAVSTLALSGAIVAPMAGGS